MQIIERFSYVCFLRVLKSELNWLETNNVIENINHKTIITTYDEHGRTIYIIALDECGAREVKYMCQNPISNNETSYDESMREIIFSSIKLNK